jgi:hypothetical protein
MTESPTSITSGNASALDAEGGLSVLSDNERYRCFLQPYMQTTDDDMTAYIQTHHNSSSFSHSVFYAPQCDTQTEIFNNY